MNWILQEARNADPQRDRVILEDPAAVRELDELLIEKYYPPIRGALQETGYPFSSIDDASIPIESRWNGTDLGRCLVFMLFNDYACPVLRGSLTRSRAGFMFEQQFFLGLPQTTDPSFLFRIMSEESFAGNRPSLTIEPSEINPDWNAYYWITLQSGSGIVSSEWTLYQAAIGNIEETIRASVEMYECAADGFTTIEDVEEFIALARKCFGAA